MMLLQADEEKFLSMQQELFGIKDVDRQKDLKIKECATNVRVLRHATGRIVGACNGSWQPHCFVARVLWLSMSDPTMDVAIQ